MFKTTAIKPYGKLKIGGDEWFLLRPEPLPPEPWQCFGERRWSVVKDTWKEVDDNDNPIYQPVRMLITANPNLIIQLIPGMQPIMIRDVPVEDDEDFVKSDLDSCVEEQFSEYENFDPD